MYDPLKAKARVAVFTATAFLTGLGIASGLGWTHVSFELPRVTEEPQLSPEAVRPALDLSEAFVHVAEIVTPAVVRIETRRPAQAGGRQQPVPEPLRRFFPDMQPDEFQPQPQLAGGSGFIISADGYILTNDHVVSGSDQVLVYLPDGRYFPARIVGLDPFTDVAVIKVDVAEALPHLSLGDSERVRVGEWVLAVGNPGFGGGSQLDYTVTAGIVSARGRGLQLVGRELQSAVRNFAIEDFIQTDAAINPGNSGGPLVDLQGRVIGINSAIASQTGFYQGYGFAIPMNLARRVMEDLVEFGHVRRALLGVAIQPVAPEDAQVYGLPSISGALISEVRPGEPAERAGIRPQDVIVEIEGKTVGYPGQLQQRVAEFRPGDEVTVTLYRERRRMDVRVRLGEAPINDGPQRAAIRPAAAEERLGLQVEPITAENARQFGFDQPGGVVISGVERGSTADRRGLQPGLQLVAINDRPVSTPEEVRSVLESTRSGEVLSFRLVHPSLQQPRIVNIQMP